MGFLLEFDTMAQSLTWQEAIKKVLGEAGVPLHYGEVTDRIIKQELRSSLGATPAATVNAHMAESIKHEGDRSPYMRVARGVFALRVTPKAGGKAPVKAVPLAPDVEDVGDVEDQYEVVTSFGMFWRRDGVDWSATPKLLGMQEIGATPVDFCGQFGVYLLYDGREVVYAGRATERPLGRRLYEHNYDRLSGRWDRFSWFGLLPVSEKGLLGKMPETFQAAKLIPALEAILIESLEPRQNRRRGDGLETVEYMQRIDPAIEKKRLKSAIEAAIEKV